MRGRDFPLISATSMAFSMESKFAWEGWVEKESNRLFSVNSLPYSVVSGSITLKDKFHSMRRNRPEKEAWLDSSFLDLPMSGLAGANPNDPAAFLKQTHHGSSGFPYDSRHFVHCDMAIRFYGLDDFVFVRLPYRDICRDITFVESASIEWGPSRLSRTCRNQRLSRRIP